MLVRCWGIKAALWVLLLLHHCHPPLQHHQQRSHQQPEVAVVVGVHQ